MKKRDLGIGLGIITILTVLVVAGFMLLQPEPVFLQGEVEATQIKISSKLVGRIQEINVREGQQVKKGTELLKISTPEIQAKLQQAMAAKDAATAQSLKATTGARVEQIAGARNMWLKAQAGAEFAKKSFLRVDNLFKEGVIAAQKRDETETRMKAAVLTEKAAKSQYNMALNGARVEDKAAALALVDRAAGAVSEVESYLKETLLIANIDGEIASINAGVGELITPGFPIIILVDLSDIWITFNVREDLLAKIKMGDTFDASFPALGNKIVKLKVSYINALGAFATWNATKTTGSFDIKTFEVKAVPVENIKGLRPGMSALVNWDELN